MDIRNATPSDARDLAFLINLAGENLPLHQWTQMAAEGQKPLDVGAERAARKEGGFSYRNAKIVEIDGKHAGMVLSYLLPDPYDTGDLDSYPDVIRPLVELEALAPGSWYVNAIATYEQFRGRGIATALMSRCEEMAVSAGAKSASLIVASENQGAHRLYLQLGYRDVASRRLVIYPGGPDGGDWVLMVKGLETK